MLMSGEYSALPINSDLDEAVPQPRGCFKKRICCNKLTVWQLLLSIFILISVVLIFGYFVIAPMIIDKVISSTDFALVSVLMRNLTNTTFVVSATCAMSSAGPFSATITPQNNFTISYLGIDIGYMPMPQINAHGGQATDLNIENNLFTITNTSQLVQFGSDLVNGDLVHWKFSGRFNMKVYGIPFHNLKFNKVVAIPGMGGLSQTQVESFSVPTDAPGQFDVQINTTIYNPSFVALELGDVYFDVLFMNSTIGTVLAKNVTMLNGRNFFTMNGIIQPGDSAALAAVNVFVNQYVAGTNSTASVRGVGGSSSAPQWLNDLAQTIHVTTTIEGAQGLDLIYNLTLQDLVMDLPGVAGEETDSGIVVMSCFIMLNFNPPFPITLNLSTVSLTSNLTDDGKVIGYFPYATYAVTYQDANNVIGFQLYNVSFYITDRGGFSDLIAKLLKYPKAEFTMSGAGSGSVSTTIGELTLENINVILPLTLNGMNAFENNGVTVVTPNDDIFGGYPGGFYLDINIIINNPSSAAIYLSSLSFDLYYQGMYVGNGTAYNITIVRGPTYAVVHGRYYKPDSVELERQFMSSFLQGNDSMINLIGNAQNIPLVVSGLSQLNISVIFPGNTQELIAWATIVNWDFIRYKNITGNVALYNPVECDVYITQLTNFSAYKTDWTKLITADDIFWDPYFLIQPNTIATTEPIAMKPTWQALYNMGYLRGNHTMIGTGIVGVMLGGYGPMLIDAMQYFTIVGLPKPKN